MIFAMCSINRHKAISIPLVSNVGAKSQRISKADFKNQNALPIWNIGTDYKTLYVFISFDLVPDKWKFDRNFKTQTNNLIF